MKILLKQPGSIQLIRDFFAVNIGTIKNFIGLVRLTLANPIRMIYLIRFAWDILRREGVWVLPHLVGGFLKKQKHQFNQDYLKWIALYDTLTDEDRNKIREHIKLLSYKPLISIIMPVWNTPEAYLRRAIESVLNQLYPYWELCIADDASEYPHIRRVLNEYQSKDKRIKVVFREKRGHIAQASNSALAIATGEFIALLDHDDILPEHALYMVAVELNRYPEADVIYTDEDRIDERGVRSDPYFKPDWNYDLFLGQNCISHLGVYRTALVREVGGFQEGYEGAQDWDLAMRIIERIPPSHIRHIPFILYHWRAIPGSAALNITEKPYVKDAQYKTLASHFERIGQKAEILSVRGIFWRIRYPVPQPPPLVTLIVTVWSREDFLIRCLNSLLKKTKFPFYQIIVIKNSKNSQKMEQYIEQIARHYPVQTIDCATSFNYAAMNNLAASQARGEILGFLHDDIEIINSNWLEEMVSHAIRPGVGAVGAMLYYPDMRIQHAGIILGLLGSVGHLYRHFPKDYSGHGGRALLTQSLSAVTGACLILRKDVFDKVGGFDEQLATAFYDVDLCLRIREQGYRIIWTPFAKLIHHAVCERQNNINNEQYKQEIVFLKERWGDILLNDPAYNPNLTLNQEDSSLAFPPRIRKPWLENNFQYR
ncbi:MAG: glycosyltransferase family 2 protein [Nitrososphaerota archaeon]